MGQAHRRLSLDFLSAATLPLLREVAALNNSEWLVSKGMHARLVVRHVLRSWALWS